MELVFLAVLQRPQPAQLQRLARQQVRIRQRVQQAPRQVLPSQDQPLRTPQKDGEHTPVRPRPQAQQRSGRVKQKLQLLTADLVLHHQKSGRRARNKSSSERQVVAATPSALKRRRKLSELHRKERARARKQRDQLGSGHEVAKARVHRNDNKNKPICTKQISPARERRAFLHPMMEAMSFCLLRRRYRLRDISRQEAM